MKVYSNTLTINDLNVAAHEVRDATGDALYVGDAITIPRARVRRNGFNVRLTNFDSRRARNTGTHGGARGDDPAASWDDYGRWIARLFVRDPSARIAHYDGAADFHAKTNNKYNV
jgi:hypothetical protein